ncbi:hypothetical protein H257_10591 [Aphanomyces astaci]|uniref:Uncharacterized protein n=1 Tax=Aphanomyces astaci TaxID=112090 RepID=W4G6S3_APHAT|nr:hypothetical protein H257_10591 [Aphanomyces astaci]ETV74986.1 hypothetical protein H257_10591 [Aphanomyces astaci]|eukprot:XP_009835490.1 hypothetical protein H257_10591 [Aphanomyces astaci]
MYTGRFHVLVIVGMEGCIVLTWSLVSIAAMVLTPTTSIAAKTVRYVVVVLWILVPVAILVYLVMLVWSACASYSPIQRHPELNRHWNDPNYMAD